MRSRLSWTLVALELGLIAVGLGSRHPEKSSLESQPSPPSSSVAPLSAEDHARYCCCGDACDINSCCCAPRKSLEPEIESNDSASDSSAQPNAPEPDCSRVCMGKLPNRPCGVPPSLPSNPHGKSTLPSHFRFSQPLFPSEFLPSSPPLARILKRASRLEDPPESLA